MKYRSRRKREGRASAGTLLFAVLLPFLCLSCSAEPRGDLLLFDFESDAELDRIHWKCHTLYSLSGEFASHGAKSLKMELYPAASPNEYPGLAPFLIRKDWRGYRELRFDVYNPRTGTESLWVRIDDREKSPAYGDRYNKRFLLRQGATLIRIPLDTLTTSGTARPLDRGKIARLLIFTAPPREKVLLYIDNMRLLGDLRAGDRPGVAPR